MKNVIAFMVNRCCLIVSTSVFIACTPAESTKHTVTKNRDERKSSCCSKFIDSVYVRQAFFGFSVHKGYRATCKSYLLNDSLSTILINNARYVLFKDENPEEISRLNLGVDNLIDAKHIEVVKSTDALKTDIRYHKLTNPYHYGNIGSVKRVSVG
jgi:hypothetical protein